MAFLDIILLAMVAAFLVFRLRSVLGKRTGNERPPHDPYAGRDGARPDPQEANDDSTVVSLPDRSGQNDAQSDIPTDIPSGTPATDGLKAIQAADSAFSVTEFIEGVRMAFEMIVTSFAGGERETLRPLLSDEVYENFAGAIVEREARSETMEMTLVGIREAEVLEATMDGRVAFVTAKIVSEQIEVVRDAAGEPVSGDPTKVSTVTDIWTFARNTRSRNPNWTLVATEAPN
ncbi:MAG: Tim44 domain-containing protein [Rhodospirillaceae bacterium]|nr:Tim44 domain-containing protein [Rhodospirillaceae bacterium]MBT6537051.1 Tim44 domain-containing protein [Rhodospirillaceae bacterium]